MIQILIHIHHLLYIGHHFFVIAFFPAKIIPTFSNLSCNCITQWMYIGIIPLLKHCISLKVKGLLCHYDCWFIIVKCVGLSLSFQSPPNKRVRSVCVNSPGSSDVQQGRKKARQLMRVCVELSIWNEADMLRDALCLFCFLGEALFPPITCFLLCSRGCLCACAVIRRRSSLSRGWRNSESCVRFREWQERAADSRRGC